MSVPTAATLAHIATAHERVEVALARLRPAAKAGRPGSAAKQTDLLAINAVLGSALYEATVGTWVLVRADLRAALKLAERARIRTVTQAVRRALERAEGLAF